LREETRRLEGELRRAADAAAAAERLSDRHKDEAQRATEGTARTSTELEEERRRARGLDEGLQAERGRRTEAEDRATAAAASTARLQGELDAARAAAVSAEDSLARAEAEVQRLIEERSAAPATADLQPVSKAAHRSSGVQGMVVQVLETPVGFHVACSASVCMWLVVILVLLATTGGWDTVSEVFAGGGRDAAAGVGGWGGVPSIRWVAPCSLGDGRGVTSASAMDDALRVHGLLGSEAETGGGSVGGGGEWCGVMSASVTGMGARVQSALVSALDAAAARRFDVFVDGRALPATGAAGNGMSGADGTNDGDGNGEGRKVDGLGQRGSMIVGVLDAARREFVSALSA